MKSNKRIPIPPELRHEVWELFAKRCGSCGEGNPIKLHIHHLDHDHNNNVLDNLFLCCAECHGFVFHPDRAEEILRWQEIKEENMKDKKEGGY